MVIKLEFRVSTANVSCRWNARIKKEHNGKPLTEREEEEKNEHTRFIGRMFDTKTSES